MKFASLVVGAAVAASAFIASSAVAEDHGGHDHAGHDHAAHEKGLDYDAAPGSEAPEEAADAHEAHGHGHVPHFSDINWFHGLIGEKEGVEPSLLWRAPGTPVPLGALFLNTAVLFFLIGRFGGPAIQSGLKGRKERIAGDIERAAEMKKEAEGQLAHYEGKLAEMASEMDRIKQEMREQAEADRQRILADAQQRREGLERDARLMLAQELAHARHEAISKAVSGAVQAAREQIEKNLNSQDQERLAAELLGSVETHLKKSEALS